MGRFIVVIEQSNQEEASPSILVPTEMSKNELTHTVHRAVEKIGRAHV